MAAQTPVTGRVARVVASALRRHGHELAGRPLVVAVSGGPDSLALLLGLMAVPEAVRPSLRVAHFSHGLRPVAQRRDAALVEEVAARWGLPVVRGSADVAAHAREERRSLEEAGRRLRYAFLARTAQECGAGAVALGHTLDDQAETVLLRIVRGAGLRGLGAMREWTPWLDTPSGVGTVLLRPLLEVSRAETLAVCAEAKVIPAQDATNRSMVFSRNRVRRRVLPELERLNPQVRHALARLASSAQADEALLEPQARSAVEGQESRCDRGFGWPRRVLAALPPPLLARVFQGAWETLRGPGAALSRLHLEAMEALLTGPSGRRLTLPAGMRFSVEYGRCTLGPAVPATPLPEEGVELHVPGSAQVGPWLVEVQRSPSFPNRKDPWTAAMDGETLGGPLAVRRRRPGDRFHPLGMDGPKRLQDFLVDEKVPRWERDAVPLVVGARGIAWVVGHRVAAWAAVTPATREAVVISFRRREQPV